MKYQQYKKCPKHTPHKLRGPSKIGWGCQGQILPLQKGGWGRKSCSHGEGGEGAGKGFSHTKGRVQKVSIPFWWYEKSHLISRGEFRTSFRPQILPFLAPLPGINDRPLKRHTCCIVWTRPSCLASFCCFWPVHITNCLRRAGWYSCRFENIKYLQAFISKYLLPLFKIQLIKTLIHDPSQSDTKKL